MLDLNSDSKLSKQGVSRLVVMIILLISMLFTPLGLVRVSANSSDVYDSIEAVYFGTETCVSCQNVIRKLAELEDKHNININIEKYDIVFDKKEDLLTQYASTYKVVAENLRTIPAIFIGETALMGEQEILVNLENALLAQRDNPKPLLELVDEVNFSGLTFNAMSVFTGGLLDGVNPCAISMMLFFISFAMVSDTKKKIIPIGLLFCLGTFLAYFSLGLGLFKFIYEIQSMKVFALIFYSVLLVGTLFLGILNIKDFVAIKKGNYGEIKNQLSSDMKGRIHKFIKHRLMDNKIIYSSAFITGFTISFLEFFCTGQIYLPMITYMISLNLDTSTNYMLLALYNFSFILPLLTITFALYLGRDVVDVSQLMLEKLSVIKLVGAIFFITASIFTAIQLIKFL